MAPEKTTDTPPPDYSTEPCPNCGSLLVKTEVAAGSTEGLVDYAHEPLELKAGDKVKRCDGCGQIVGKVKAPAKKKTTAKRKRSTSKKPAAAKKPAAKRKRSTSSKPAASKRKRSTSSKPAASKRKRSTSSK